ncbi:MAG: putative quinol monooxygenase, partial [Pseudomonadales bacterium]
MIIVHGIIPLRPDTRDQALAMARRMAEATQAEPGCIAYDFYVGLGDPNRLLLFQEWESMEALAAHFETPHMDQFMRELPHVLAGEIQTRR